MGIHAKHRRRYVGRKRIARSSHSSGEQGPSADGATSIPRKEEDVQLDIEGEGTMNDEKKTTVTAEESLQEKTLDICLRSFQYHPSDPCSRMDGCIGNLTSTHKVTLRDLEESLGREGMDLSAICGSRPLDDKQGRCPPEDETMMLLRFLRHNNWDLDQTRAQVSRNLTWRWSKQIPGAFLGREPWEIVACPNAETFDRLCRLYYPHFLLGGDRLGRPVLLQKYGALNLSELKRCIELEALLSYHVWEQEKNAELLRLATMGCGHLVESYTMILDFKDMGIGIVSADFLWLLREITQIDRSFYCGRPGVTYIINTPPIFGLVWQGIRGFVESTRARVHILGDEKEWKRALAEAIDPRQLPGEYGGSAPPLSDTPLLPAVHVARSRGDATVSGRPIDDFIGVPPGLIAAAGLKARGGDGACFAGAQVSSRACRGDEADHGGGVSVHRVDDGGVCSGGKHVDGAVPGTLSAGSVAEMVVGVACEAVASVTGVFGDVAGGAANGVLSFIEGCVMAVTPESARAMFVQAWDAAGMFAGWAVVL